MNMHTSVLPLSPAKAAAVRYLSCLRLQEILVLQGSPLLGAAFAIRHPAAEHIGPLAILTVANLCLVAHIFLLNDWSGLATDLADPNKASSVFTARGVGHKEIGGLTAGLLALSLFLFSRLGPVTLCLALAIAALSALYSLPQLNWKGRPLLSSAAHLAGGVLHFLLGYSLGSAIDRRGLATATFFALIFAAGHLTQEIRDHQGDVLNAIRTNAVAFGRRRTFVASLALFTLAHTLLLVLALQGTLPRSLAALVVLYPLHLRWSLETLAEGLTYAGICRLQARYRALYAVAGLAMVAALYGGAPGLPQNARSEALPQAPPAAAAITAELQRLTQLRFDANAINDRSFYERLLAPNFLLLGPYHFPPSTKKGYLDAEFPAGRAPRPKSTIRELQASVAGDTAVVSYQVAEPYPLGGEQRFEQVSRRLDTYVRIEGAWRLLSMAIAEPPSWPDVATIDPRLYSEYSGTYQLSQDTLILVTNEAGHLMAQVTGQEKIELFPESSTTFFDKSDSPLARTVFERDSSGKVIAQVYRSMGQKLRAKKIR